MKVSEPLERVFLITHTNSVTLAKMFLRFQEYYESPKFKGTIFTFKTFRKWYSKRGKFTYYSDWGGFNVPGYVIDFFRTGAFNPLTPLEQKLLDAIPVISDGQYYVIGAPPNSIDTKTHEIAHALYYLKPSYHKLVNKSLKLYNTRSRQAIKKVKDHLISIRYDKSVLKDELHAWLMTEKVELIEQRLWIPEFDQYHRELNLMLQTAKGVLQDSTHTLRIGASRSS